MAEEAVGIIESGENGGTLNEGVSEADVQKVQENARQIKKIAQQLKQDKQQNNKLANFLTFLLNNISNDNIIKGLYNTFFITIDPKTNIPYFRKSMNDMVVVGLFYPFFKEKAEELGINIHYEGLKGASDSTIHGYILYLQDLSEHYHDDIPLNQESFVQLLVEIIKEYLYNAPDNSTLDNKESPEDAYKKLLKKELYLE